MSVFDGSQLEVAETHALFRKRESDFLRQLAEFPVSQDTKEIYKNAFQWFFPGLLSEIAGSDGPINQREAYMINHLTGQTHELEEYKNFFNINRANGSWDLNKNDATSMIDVMIRVSASEQFAGGQYDVEHDHIVELIQKMGQLVVNADEKVDEVELKTFSRITSIAHAKATKVAQELDAQKKAFGIGGAQDRLAGEAPATKKEQGTKKKEPEAGSINAALQELHTLIGLTNVKQEVERLVNLAKIFAIRKQKGLPVPDISFHLVFSGNPGTGKTTVARIISSVYGQLGLLSKGHLVEVDRSGLVANYVGQTATKVKNVIDQSLGGILFIDEAYSLVSHTENDFGPEAIEILLKAMEDHRNDLVVIAAGYADRMQSFLGANPGLRSRFPNVITFPDYSSDELCAIFDREAKQARYEIDNDARKLLSDIMQKRWQQRGSDFANAREVRNLFERVISMQANRIAGSSVISDEMLTEIVEEDIRQALNS